MKPTTYSHQPKAFRSRRVGVLLTEVNQSLKKLEQLKSQFYRLEKQTQAAGLK